MEDLDSQDYFVVVTLVDENGVFVEKYFKNYIDWEMSQDGTFDVLPKKEVIEIKKEWDKLEKNLGGIKNMKRLPDAIFVL